MNFNPETKSLKSPENKEKIRTLEGAAGELSKTVSDIEKEIKVLEEKKLSPEKVVVLKTTKEKILNVCNKFLRITRRTALIGSIFAVTHYNLTHDNLEKVVDKETGKITYHHPDKKTEHLLNVIAGVDSISEEDALNDWKASIEYAIKNGIMETVEKVDIEKMNLDEFGDFIDKQTGQEEKGHFKEAFYKELNQFYRGEISFKDYKFNRITNPDNLKGIKMGASKDLYNLVWQLEEECGNPKIDFVSSGFSSVFSSIGVFKGANRYNPVSNTIYLKMDEFSRSGSYRFISEMAHAKQFNDSPVSASLETVKDLIGVFKKGKFDTKKLTKEYDELYSRPGTIEFEAHKIIEPRLREEYKLYVSKKGGGEKDKNTKK